MFQSQSILLHTRNGTSFTGILTHFDLQPEPALVLSHVLPHPLPDPAPAPKRTFVVQPKEISSISATQIAVGNSNASSSTSTSGFRTDAAISNVASASQRPLERWQPDAPSNTSGMSGSLEQSALPILTTTGGQWDQFAANERMFGLKSSYKEEFYTTRLDRSHPDYEKRYREAESIAREIESKVSSNPHLAEERGQKVDDSGLDEEDKYSGVIREHPPSTQAPPQQMAYAAAAAGNKYTPPAKREQLRSSPATTTPAPVDPAIISSKLRTEPPIRQPSPSKPQDPSKPTISLSIHTPSTTNGAPLTIPIVKEPEPSPTLSADPSSSNLNTTPLTTPQMHEISQKFVKDEKIKIKKARNLIGTKEKQRQFAEFAQFSTSLKLNMPVPQDLLPILAGKDAAKQKAILERNNELKKKQEEETTHKGKEEKTPEKVAEKEVEKEVAKEKSPSVGPAVVPSPTVVSPITSPGPTLAERLKANQQRAPGSVPSPIASPTPLEPGTVKPPPTVTPTATATTTKKLDPAAKEFVFKVSAKEFNPREFKPASSTHSPSPSRSTVVSPPPRQPEKPVATGFWDKKTRPDETSIPASLEELDTFASQQADFRPSNEGEKFQIAMAYATHPAWPSSDASDEQNQKGYMDIFTEGRSIPTTPNSVPQDDAHSQSGHSYSRSSSVHPSHHASPHPPAPIPAAPPVVQGYPTTQAMYPPMGPIPVNQYGGFMIPQTPMHTGQPVQQYTPQLIGGQFQQQHQGGPSPYGPRFNQQGYQSVGPSPLLPHAMQAQYPPQQAFQNGQFAQGFPPPAMYAGVPGYAFVPQQGPNGGFTSGHPSPGRGNAAMVYQNMPPMVPQQMYQGISPQLYL